jgi:hypothetical protein
VENPGCHLQQCRVDLGLFQQKECFHFAGDYNNPAASSSRIVVSCRTDPGSGSVVSMFLQFQLAANYDEAVNLTVEADFITAGK